MKSYHWYCPCEVKPLYLHFLFLFYRRNKSECYFYLLNLNHCSPCQSCCYFIQIWHVCYFTWKQADLCYYETWFKPKKGPMIWVFTPCVIRTSDKPLLLHNVFQISWAEILLVQNIIIYNSQIQVSTNMSIVVKPQNFEPMKLNDFTVRSLFTAKVARLELSRDNMLHVVVVGT